MIFNNPPTTIQTCLSVMGDTNELHTNSVTQIGTLSTILI